MSERKSISIDGAELDVTTYSRMHAVRIDKTMDLLRKYCERRVIELGAHPWVMTSALSDDSGFEVLATVSAEEATLWPDDFGFTHTNHTLKTVCGRLATIKNYSFNVERRLVDLDETPDAVLACEIVEHLVRAPHVLFLNVNRWLKPGGVVIVTTPNGSQFMNPFRRKPRMPAFRAHSYERHSYVFRLTDLADLVGLCGFEILDSGYWSPYPDAGFRRILAGIPGPYFSEKFERTLYIVARKSRSVEALPRLPRVYEPSGAWEYVSTSGGSHSESRSSRTATPAV